MIKVEIRNSFIRDLKNLKGAPNYEKIKSYIFNELPAIPAFENISNLKKLRGFKGYYRIKIGDYRIGLTYNEHLIILVRILHRKDIYKHFPK